VGGNVFETTTDEVLAGVDLTGTVALVTGASTGLGLETARALAPPARRSRWRCARTSGARRPKQTIRDRVPAAVLECGLVDLTVQASVREFANWFAAAMTVSTY